MQEVQHVFLVGAKGIGFYGGYETFVYKLTEYHQNNEKIKYHIACKANGQGCMDEKKLENIKKINRNEFEFHNAHCFKVRVNEKLKSAQAIAYDIDSLKKCIEIIKIQRIEHPIVYIMACRIGLWIRKYYQEIKKLGGKIYLNPDGHEWMRTKWFILVRKYWKFSERLMVKNADLIICDSLNIEKYIKEIYGKQINTTYIAYGSETRKSKLLDDDLKFLNWLKEKKLKKGQYYLSVGRFVPENNYEIMIREFMKSNTNKDFVIITMTDTRFLKKLEAKLHFKSDQRIKFVGTVYDQELLMKIRENAYANFHGHEVGGTNPSLLEALGSTKLNLLYNVGFNREVAKNTALYWTKEEGNLAQLINRVDKMEFLEIEEIGKKAKMRVVEGYTWDKICRMYEEAFLCLNKII